MITALIEQGYEVVALAPPDEHVRKVEELGVKFIPIEIDKQGVSPVNDLILFARYFNILRQEKPDVFLGFTIKPNIYGSLAAQLLEIPVINNVSGLGTVFIRHSPITKIVHLLYRRAFRRSVRVFFQNEDDKNLFLRLKLVTHHKTGLLPGSGVDLGFFKPVSNGTHSNSNHTIFLLIARLLWDKGVGEYVEAAKLVQSSHPDARFQLLGFLDVENRTAISRHELDKWVHDGVITYLGQTDDVRPYISEVSCVVLPSYREGTPRTLLEAAAMEKPLIATDVPGCREVIDDGGNGFLCEVRNSVDLAQKMQDFIDLSKEKRTRMGQASRKKIEQNFDENIVIDRYLMAIGDIFSIPSEDD